MKCFNHSEVDAIGGCKACAKGLCHACATDLDHGLACKDKHESDVTFLYTLVERSRKTIEIQPQSAMAGNLSWIIMGLIFVGFGFYQANTFLTVFGGFCIIYWLYLAIYNSGVFKKLDQKET